MKTQHALITGLFLSVLPMSSLLAQPGFNSKQKRNTSVNTSSLKARHTLQVPGNRSIIPAKRSFQQLVLQQQDTKVIYSPETGLPSFITSARNVSTMRLGSGNDVYGACAGYLAELKPLLRITRPEADFLIRSIKTDRSNKLGLQVRKS